MGARLGPVRFAGGLVKLAGPPKVRLNLALPPSVIERLDRLQTLTEAESATEVIRRALALYESYVLAGKAGHAVYVEDDKGRRAPLKVF